MNYSNILFHIEIINKYKVYSFHAGSNLTIYF